MAETAKYQVHNELGCGLMNSIFHLRGLGPWKSQQKPLPSTKPPPASDPKPRKDLNSGLSPRITKNNVQKSQITRRRPSDASRNSISSSSNNSGQTQKKREIPEFTRLKKEPSFTSGDLSLAVSSDHHRPSNPLLRASSGNIMLLGHLGNLKQKQQEQGNKTTANKSSLFHPRAVVTGNIGANKLDPEVMKTMGNEKYKEGRFEEALSLYNQAISVNPNRPSYHSNKSAALVGLGRLVEAVFACTEAVRIEPSYRRAHCRLATLYLRLGEAEKALHHYKQSDLKADYDQDIVKAQSLKLHLSRLNKARELKDWSSLVKEAHSVISSGADLSPKIFALQVEAQLKLHRHKEAYDTFQKLPHYDVDSCTRLFGPAYVAYLLSIQAQVYMIAGRIEDALSVSQQAARLDPSAEANTLFMKKAQAVASARSRGNHLFKASKFSEAYVSYNEGLDHDPYNSVLLCNRAACRFKLGQFEKAVEDCTASLNVRPSYSKARLRRADCNVKMEHWKAAIQDYELLIREKPGDEEVGKALFEARVHLKKQHGEDTHDMKFGANVVLVASNEQFRHSITSPGMSVVLFCNRTCQKNVLQLVEQVCQRFPSVNFLKVEIEDHPYLAKYEGVSSVPAFKIYKNGSIIREIPGSNSELLESAVKVHCS